MHLRTQLLDSPSDTIVPSTHKYVCQPLPIGCTKADIERILQPLQWQHVPITALSPTKWLIGAEEIPSTTVLHYQETDIVLMKWQPRRAFSKPANAPSKQANQFQENRKGERTLPEHLQRGTSATSYAPHANASAGHLENSKLEKLEQAVQAIESRLQLESQRTTQRIDTMQSQINKNEAEHKVEIANILSTIQGNTDSILKRLDMLGQIPQPPTPVLQSSGKENKENLPQTTRRSRSPVRQSNQ